MLGLQACANSTGSYGAEDNLGLEQARMVLWATPTARKLPLYSDIWYSLQENMRRNLGWRLSSDIAPWGCEPWSIFPVSLGVKYRVPGPAEKQTSTLYAIYSEGYSLQFADVGASGLKWVQGISCSDRRCSVDPHEINEYTSSPYDHSVLSVIWRYL